MSNDEIYSPPGFIIWVNTFCLVLFVFFNTVFSTIPHSKNTISWGSVAKAFLHSIVRSASYRKIPSQNAELPMFYLHSAGGKVPVYDINLLLKQIYGERSKYSIQAVYCLCERDDIHRLHGPAGLYYGSSPNSFVIMGVNEEGELISDAGGKPLVLRN